MTLKQSDRPEDGRRATIRDVAAKAGVSVATVSRVLAGTYPTTPATRDRVMQAIQELNYVMNVYARALAGVSNKVVAMVLTEVMAPFYAQVAHGVEEQAAREGRLCLICTTNGDPDRELAVVKLLREQGADAVILVGGVVETDEYRMRMAQFAQSLAASGGRLVFCGRPGLGPDVPAVVVEYDNVGGAHAVTSHLISAGHERILFLGGKEGHSTSLARVAGYRNALAARGITLDPSLIVHGSFGRRWGYAGMREVLAARQGKPDFTAVFASDDMLAAGALKALKEAGLRVPEDISVVGYDDIALSQDLAPPLTTVHIPGAELGRTSVRLALHPDDQLSGSAHVMLGTHVVVRESVAHR